MPFAAFCFKFFSMSKTVIISGAAGNLGMAVSARFLIAGWKVVALAEKGQASQEKILKGLNDGKIIVHSGDLMDPYATSNLVREIWAENDQIDAAVCLVGGFAMNALEKATSEQLEKMIRLNVFTAYNIVQPLFALMKDKKGGSLTMIGARPALIPSDAADMLAYALSKGMLFHLAEIINAGSAKHGVFANVAVPSIIDTPQNRAAMPKANFEDWVSPEEVAEAIFFATEHNTNGLGGSVLKLYGRV
jgi:NAD(P)-dependent dehydrogenase (short-subunit alcohol dehydrogenase family)